MKVFLKISFLGTRYCGYQVQGNAVTVQQMLNEAAERVFGFPCDIVGCSRTDSGVHAEEFCVCVTKRKEAGLVTTVPVSKIPVAMNCFLPDDISVLEASLVPEEFHARYDVKYKEYVYRIWNGRVKNPFLADRMMFLPMPIGDGDVERANEAAGAFVGRKDFRAFMASGSKITDTVRTVYHASLSREGDVITFRVAADGFLYNMVRIMAGTLVEVLQGRRTPDEVATAIASCDRRRAGSTAPACGLYLHRVSYETYQEKGGEKQ
ncbi:MAG: tRNA pseudouridine(38-40) synthase TruA [Clostridia bacterium]|nr:tRNA pseudouridine(38-40) synthase TruA [Clostridia bacterium]